MTALLDAIINGDIHRVTQELDNGASANQIGQDGLSALHYAAMANQPEIFKLLVAKGGNIHAVDHHQNTTLYYAARHMADGDFVQYILDNGVAINAQNKIGQSALHMAARLGNISALHTLLINGANATLKNLQGKTALHDAVGTNHVKESLLLIEYGANANAQDNYRKSPKDIALKSGFEAMELLFSLPILDQIKLANVHSNLVDYVIAGDLDGVKEKLALGVYSDVGNSHHFTALHYAVINGEKEIAAVLSKEESALISTNDQGQQAIHFAAMTHDSAIIDLLHDLGAAINAVDNKGNTPLHYAVDNSGSGVLVQHLLDLGAHIDAKNYLGETALHVAAREGNTDAVQVLVANHADEKIEDKMGETPLEEAINAKANDVIALLKHAPMIQPEVNEEISNPYRKFTLQTSDVLDENSTIFCLEDLNVPEMNAVVEVQESQEVEQPSLLPVVPECVILESIQAEG